MISTDGGQTVLRLVHSGFDEGANWDEQIDGLSGGWRYFLWNLQVCLTHHLGARRTLVSARKRSAVSRATLWASLFASGLLAVSTAGEGDQCTLTLGDRSFDGLVTMSEAPYRLAARFPSLADALLFVELEGAAPENFHVGVWLSTYGVEPHVVSELQRTLDDVVTRLIEPTVAATL